MKTRNWLTNTKPDKRLRRYKRRLERGYYTNKHSELQARDSLYKCQLKNKATKAELILGDILEEMGFYFKFQKSFYKPFHRIVDFYLPLSKTIIEVDGGYHAETIAKDNHKDKEWAKKGYKTIRLTNEDVYQLLDCDDKITPSSVRAYLQLFIS